MTGHGSLDKALREMCRTTRLAGRSTWFGDGERLGLEPSRAFLIIDGGVGSQKPSGTGIIAVNDGVDDRFGWQGGAVVVVLGDI